MEILCSSYSVGSRHLERVLLGVPAYVDIGASRDVKVGIANAAAGVANLGLDSSFAILNIFWVLRLWGARTDT